MKELVVGGKLVEDAVAELNTLLEDVPAEQRGDGITMEAAKESIVEMMVLPLIAVKAEGRTVGQMIQAQDIVTKVRGGFEHGGFAVTLDDADYKVLKDEFDAFRWKAVPIQQVTIMKASQIISQASEPQPKKEEK